MENEEISYLNQFKKNPEFHPILGRNPNLDRLKKMLGMDQSSQYQYINEEAPKDTEKIDIFLLY